MIGDKSISEPNNVKRVVMCSGQVYYDLVKARTDAGLDGEVAIVRSEQALSVPA